MAAWTLRGGDLAAALRPMARMAKGAAGHAGWYFEADSLRIAWAGQTVTVPASGAGVASVMVRGSVMSGVVKLPLPKAGDHLVRIADGRLYLDGSFSVPCETLPAEVPQLLPVHPRPLDVALLPHRHRAEEIEAAGLGAQVSASRTRMAASIREAAEALKWLGVAEAHVGAWVEAHLGALAHNKATFALGSVDASTERVVVVDQNGQVDLFPRR